MYDQIYNFTSSVCFCHYLMFSIFRKYLTLCFEFSFGMAPYDFYVLKLSDLINVFCVWATTALTYIFCMWCTTHHNMCSHCHNHSG